MTQQPVEESSMRRLVVALIVAALALTLAGCGGGGTEASTSAAPAAAPATATAAGSSTAALPIIDNKSENETTTFEPFPTGATVPADLHQKISIEKQPTLIYFYDSTQQTSDEVRRIIDAVRYENRGMVDLVAYDIGAFVTTNSDGSITVDDALAKDAGAKAAVGLARDPAIHVTFTPFIIITDGQGYIIYKHRGLIDKQFLEREVLRASR
jgi:hypothetical protein